MTEHLTQVSRHRSVPDFLRAYKLNLALMASSHADEREFYTRNADTCLRAAYSVMSAITGREFVR